MKASDLKKNCRASLRINATMKNELEKRGHSIQSLFDTALDRLIGHVDVTEKITVIKDQEKSRCHRAGSKLETYVLKKLL